jgi:lipopolysaccharide transport system permease protein
MRFLIQFATLIILIAAFVFFQDFSLNFNIWFLAVPLSIVMIGMIALGSGLIFSVFTAKYRDINNLVMLIIRLLMFFTPVIYPLSSIPENYRWIVAVNPLSALFEVFRIGLLGQGSITPFQLVYSTVFTVIVFFSGILIFNKQSDKLIDVI